MLIAVIGSVHMIALVLLVFWVRGWEARVDVLRGLLVLGIFPCLHARNISILERTVLIKSATYKVGAVRQIGRTRTDLDWTASHPSLLL
jgi:hypothetical protein